MKREYINIKKKIKKKIELRHNNVLLIEKRRNINATSTNKLNSLINILIWNVILIKMIVLMKFMIK